MPFITLELLKRKAEHHDGPLSELEELSLHQLELERIDVVGTTCRRLRILYLQNNVIPRLENLHHLKELRYLNVALNNITAIEGLGCVMSRDGVTPREWPARRLPSRPPPTATPAVPSCSACEFLEKLDMTVNFVDVDALEAGVAHLAQLAHLADVYLIGNPAAQWAGYRSYVVHALPALRQLDGVEVTRAERIHARQAFPQLRDDLRVLAAAKAAERAAADAAASATAMPTSAPADGDASAPWTPEARAAMYREVAEQKAADDARRRGNEPRARDAAAEHATAVAAERAREAAATAGRAPPQCNTGKWQFAVDDDGGTAGTVALRLGLPRFVDSSLVDVDVHPAFVAVVAKGKVRCVCMSTLLHNGGWG